MMRDETPVLWCTNCDELYDPEALPVFVPIDSDEPAAGCPRCHTARYLQDYVYG
jgi:Zn finger protein HypA/HybF involved in hydrogenase expression